MDIIKQIMEDNDLSVQQLANRLGRHRTTVYKWLQHKSEPDKEAAYMLLDMAKTECSLEQIYQRRPH